jgi:hypothetical protein
MNHLKTIYQIFLTLTISTIKIVIQNYRFSGVTCRIMRNNCKDAVQLIAETYLPQSKSVNKSTSFIPYLSFFERN